MKLATSLDQRKAQPVLLLSGKQHYFMCVVCDSHIYTDCRKGDHREGTVDFAHLSFPVSLLRTKLWKTCSLKNYILYLKPLSGWLDMQQTCQESALRLHLEMEYLKSLQNERCSFWLGLPYLSCSCSLPQKCLLMMHLVCLLFSEETQSCLCQTFIILRLAIPLHL